jgi:hypothetical protein
MNKLPLRLDTFPNELLKKLSFFVNISGFTDQWVRLKFATRKKPGCRRHEVVLVGRPVTETL